MSYYLREKELLEKNVEYRKMTKSLYYQIIDLLELYPDYFNKIDNNTITDELLEDINGKVCFICKDFYIVSWGYGSFLFLIQMVNIFILIVQLLNLLSV